MQKRSRLLSALSPLGKLRATSARRTSFFEQLESRQLLSSSLSLGGVISGHITTPNQTVSYTFSESKTSEIQLATLQSTDKGFTAAFGLFNGSGAEIDAWTANNLRVEHLLSGKYTMKVAASDHMATGGYNVGLEGLAPISPSPTKLSLGGVKSGSTSGALDVKEYVFTPTAGAQMQIATLQGSSSGFTAQFTLYNTAGSAVDQWTANNVRTENHLTASQYMLKVNATNLTAKGSFQIGLEGIAPISPSPTTLIFGGVHKSSISGPLVVKEYVFTPKSNAQVQIATLESDSPEFTAQYTLYNSAGSTVDQWTANNVRTENHLTASQYMLKVSATNYSATGSFSIGLEGIAPISPDPKNLNLGGVVKGSISSPLDVKEYVFTPKAGAIDQIATLESDSPQFAAQFTLYNSAGGVVDEWTENNVRTERNLSASQYMLKITATNYTATGSFSIGLEGIAPISPAPTTLSGTTHGTISASLQVHEYVFSALKGTTVELKTTEISGPGFNAEFILYDSKGNTVDEWLGNNDRMERNLAGGQYMLKVSASDYISTGSYSITT